MMAAETLAHMAADDPHTLHSVKRRVVDRRRHCNLIGQAAENTLTHSTPEAIFMTGGKFEQRENDAETSFGTSVTLNRNSTIRGRPGGR